MASPLLPYGLAMSETSTTRPVQCYASIEDLRKIIIQAENEHHEGSLGIVRFALRDEGNGNFDVDIENTPDRILVA